LAAPKQDESFKVVDRRLFTAEGELRKEALEQERREEVAPKPKPATPTTSPASAAGPSSSSPTAASGVAGSPSTAEAPKPSRSFQSLIVFLTDNTAALLNGYPDPSTGQLVYDVEAAREFIDMLDALHEKTRGNLAPEEDQLLLDVAGRLKLAYVELSKAAAQQMQEKAKTRS
jgi:hypothetical protein